MSYSIDGTYTPDLVEEFGSVKKTFKSGKKNFKKTQKTIKYAKPVLTKLGRGLRGIGRANKGLGKAAKVMAPIGNAIDVASGIAFAVDYFQKASDRVQKEIAAEKDKQFYKFREQEEKREREAEEYQEKIRNTKCKGQWLRVCPDHPRYPSDKKDGKGTWVKNGIDHLNQNKRNCNSNWEFHEDLDYGDKPNDFFCDGAVDCDVNTNVVSSYDRHGYDDYSNASVTGGYRNFSICKDIYPATHVIKGTQITKREEGKTYKNQDCNSCSNDTIKDLHSDSSNKN